MKTLTLISSSLLILLSTLTFKADRLSVVGTVKKLEGNVLIMVNGYEIKADKALINQGNNEIIATSSAGNKVQLNVRGDQHFATDSIRLNYQNNTFVAAEISLIKN
mgnify:CR=1 FL=1